MILPTVEEATQTLLGRKDYMTFLENHRYYTQALHTTDPAIPLLGITVKKLQGPQ